MSGGAGDGDVELRVRGLQAKQVHDISMSEDSVKVGRKGRFALYKAMHGFILAAGTLAEESASAAGRKEASPEDLVAALEHLGCHNAASRVAGFAAADARKDEDERQRREQKKSKKAAAKKPSSRKPSAKKSAKSSQR
eukprot:TRINITY_DN22954_c0_g1_i1.p1 TRINITY_DN22954_c0_g1~~TRINITY_DN22954_c0_g1_i1.p1  ORF type:complete len:138 (+),score=44.95 TRINITY_DN22954_c0_g1_i1:93-506(+)